MNFLEFFNNPYFLLATQFISLVIKVYILQTLFQHKGRGNSTNRAWLFIVIVLSTTIFESLVWSLKLSSTIGLINIPYTILLALIRLAWAGSVIQHQATVLFLYSLVNQDKNLGPIEKTLVTISACLASYFIGIAFSDFSIKSVQERYAFMDTYPLEAYVMRYSAFFCFVLIGIYAYSTIKSLKHLALPRILKLQLKFFAFFFIAPYIASEFATTIQFIIHMNILLVGLSTDHFYYLIVSVSTMLLTWGLLYCTRRVMGLRFLNSQPQVQSPQQFSFMNDFAAILDQLSLATNASELAALTQVFFRDAFRIPIGKTKLYVRRLNQVQDDEPSYDLLEMTMEHFIGSKECEPYIHEFIKKHPVLIKDDLEFTNFYEETNAQQDLLHLLDAITADILIPIYSKRLMIGYIIIERDARPHELYTDLEQDEMTILGRYLHSVISLIQQRDLSTLIEKEHTMSQEVDHKELEIDQYKESISSFAHAAKDRKIGILFYRNRRFTFTNQAAQELIRLNVNTQVGHHLSKALRKATRTVEETKAPYSILTKDVRGKKLVLSAIPSLDQSHIIIVVYYPELTDLLTPQVGTVRNTSDWDYLLYLETTQFGKVINQLVPANTPKLLNFKIQMLRLGLSPKPILLSMPERDLLPTIEILHNIRQSPAKHIMHLTEPCTTIDTAVRLFGMNPIFTRRREQSLFEQLSNNGTLFIRNIEYLDLEAQEYLAEYIRYGLYRLFKSDKKVASKVRLIFSTSAHLEELVTAGTFSKNLYEELSKTPLAFPPFESLSDNDIQELMMGFAELATISPTFKNLLELTNRERDRFSYKRPSSLQEIKEYIQKLLNQKSERSHIVEENMFDPALGITDPKLAEASRMGKSALKKPDIMTMLWKKFKNQNKIAIFLGVNRSSVNRRLRNYNKDKESKAKNSSKNSDTDTSSEKK